MSEAFDTTGAKINPIAHLIEIDKKNVKGEQRIAPAFTPKELAELRATDAKRAQRELDAPYLGYPKPPPPPTKRQLLIREIARDIVDYASSISTGDNL